MLGLSTLLSAIVMYFSMYAMIDTLQSFYNNINQVYMALMMVAPMVVIMLLTMRAMYPDAKLNGILYIGMTSEERTGEILDGPADLSWHNR